MIHVLFVCLGNICRSPMAEGFFKQAVLEAGLENKIKVDSAAIGSWNLGNPPHHGTQQVLMKHGIDFSQMRARKISQADFENNDYIIGMDAENMADLKTFPNKTSVVRSLMSYVPGKEEQSIPDPYYTGNFAETERLVSEGCHFLLAAIKKEQQL